MKPGKTTARANVLQAQLQEALAECARLREENARLRALLGLPCEAVAPTGPTSIAVPPAPDPVTGDSPVEAKIALFRNLFRGREDVYAARWETKKERCPGTPRNPWHRGGGG